MRAGKAIPSLRSERVFSRLGRALGASTKAAFRVVHFSVQQDHVHLLVEADSPAALTNGVWGLAVRTARAVNRAVGRRGQVWSHRYHRRGLSSPREVRAGLAYVLLNFRKHLRAAPGLDPRSSGIWFDGWRATPAIDGAHSGQPSPPIAGRARERPPCLVAPPRTWLAKVGWRRAGGLLDPAERPAPAIRPASGRGNRRRR
jgi:hypothetical protein